MKGVGSLSVLLSRSAGPGTGPDCGVTGGVAAVPADNGVSSLGKFAVDDSMGGLLALLAHSRSRTRVVKHPLPFSLSPPDCVCKYGHMPRFRITAHRGVSSERLFPRFSFQAGMAS